MRGRKRNISEAIKDYDSQKLSKTARHPLAKLRYLAFSHIQDGKSNIEIAKMLKVNRMAISNWIKDFNQEGINGLKEKGGKRS